MYWKPNKFERNIEKNIPKKIPKKIGAIFDDNYTEYKSEVFENISMGQYLERISPYLRNMINYFKSSD